MLISQGRSPQICRLCVSLQNQKFALRDKTSFNCFVIDNHGLMAKKCSLIKAFDSWKNDMEKVKKLLLLAFVLEMCTH